ncbi:MAG: Fur family transcriptional regulator [Actinomycetota bacterium]
MARVRNTRQRSAILEALEEASGFRSAQEIHAHLRAEGTAIGLATVYRALQTFSESGDVDVVRREDGEAIYRRCATDHHHHHLVCRACGYSVEIDNAELETWAERSARKHGFSDVTHDLEIFGTCQRCSA